MYGLGFPLFSGNWDGNTNDLHCFVYIMHLLLKVTIHIRNGLHLSFHFLHLCFKTGGRRGSWSHKVIDLCLYPVIPATVDFKPLISSLCDATSFSRQSILSSYAWTCSDKCGLYNVILPVTYLVLQGLHLLLFGWFLGFSSRGSSLGRPRVGLHISAKEKEE